MSPSFSRLFIAVLFATTLMLSGSAFTADKASDAAAAAAKVSDQIDKDLQTTADAANKALARAAIRDNYVESRRELESNRSGYPVGTDQYNNYTDQIMKLDLEFANNPAAK